MKFLKYTSMKHIQYTPMSWFTHIAPIFSVIYNYRKMCLS